MMLLLAGCTEGVATRELVRSEIIRVQITPSLMHWQTKLHSCALGLVDANIVLEILPPDDLKPEKADLSLRFGPKQAGEMHVSILADEQLVFIVHAENPLQEISVGSLKAIFSGEVKNWQQLPEMENSDFGIDLQPIQFEANNDLSKVLSSALGISEGVTSEGYKVPSLADMVQAVGETPGAIGYSMESQLQGAVKTLDVLDEDALSGLLAQPIIAITNSDPEGSLLQLLLCLQASE